MNNMNQLMKQVQQMQKKFEEAQSKMDDVEVIGTSGGGMVSIAMDGKSKMKRIDIDKSLLVPDDVEILSDLIVAAYNDAKTKLDAKMSEQMGGLLPNGMNLPF